MQNFSTAKFSILKQLFLEHPIHRVGFAKLVTLNLSAI